MTQFFEDFMEQRKDWGLTVSPAMQQAIDTTNEIEKAANGLIDLFAPYYPDIPSNNHMNDCLCDAINALMDQVEKRIVRHILDDSEPINRKKNMRQD